jgi:hypothetical protein
LIAFHTSSKNDVHYSLDCNNGHFSGVAQPVPKPGGGYVAPAVATFEIGKTIEVTCVLRSVAPSEPKVHTARAHNYPCVKTAGVSGSGDLTADSPHNPRKPDKPGKLVADPPRTPDAPKDNGKPDASADKGKISEPKIVCAGGKVRNGTCICARAEKKLKVAKSTFRCVKGPVLDPVRTKGGNKTSGGSGRGDRKSELNSNAKPPKPKSGAARTSNASSKRLVVR